MALTGTRLLTPFVIIAAMALLTACGGGLGQDHGVPRALSYSGLTDAAAITESNAETLALDSYTGGAIGTIPYAGFSTRLASPPDGPGFTRRQKMIAAIKKSARRINIPSTLVTGADRVVAEELPLVNGNCGGTVQSDVDLNTESGGFYGTFEYREFCQNGITISGAGEMWGIFDFDANIIREMHMAYEVLSVQQEGTSFKIAGWLEFNVNRNGSETDRMDLVLKDEFDGKTYWICNYTNVHTVHGSYRQFTVDGRFYHHDDGYVEVSTVQAVRLDTLYSWPTQGILVVTGRDNAWVRMTFKIEGYIYFEVDFNNDGEVDRATEYWYNDPAGANTQPRAMAGTDQTVSQNSSVYLDGGGSFDADGDPLTYIWSFAQCPGGGCPALSDAHAVAPSFYAETPGQYEIHLVVNDGQADSRPDNVFIQVVADDLAPVANAGADQTVVVNNTVYLDGSASYDPESGPITFQWTMTACPETPCTGLTSATTSETSFDPETTGFYEIELMVNDGRQDSSPDTVVIEVTP